MLQGYVHPDFGKVAELLSNQIPRNKPGGAALSVYHHGQCVIDIWGGTRNNDGDPWLSDTLAMSFSTTQGVVSTLLHILVDDGLLSYDDPVCKYWPEFDQRGKHNITIRQVLCHEAGMFHIRDMIDDAERMLDWSYMIRALERSSPIHTPGLHNGYHALTYGWLIGEIIRRATNKSFQKILDERLIRPLGLDGLFIGTPEEHLGRRAHLVTKSPIGQNNLRLPGALQKAALKTATRGLKLANIDLNQTISALIPKGSLYLDFNQRELATACIPSINGMFTARSLAKLYAALANHGKVDGQRILSHAATQNLAKIQNRSTGKVIPLPMNWRLGYHRIFALGVDTSSCFGHCGFGGSGAWADPVRGISVALVPNSGLGTPFGDMRLASLSTAIIRCAEKRYHFANTEEVRGIGPFFPRDRRSGYGTAKRLVNGVIPKRRKADSTSLHQSQSKL